MVLAEELQSEGPGGGNGWFWVHKAINALDSIHGSGEGGVLQDCAFLMPVSAQVPALLLRLSIMGGHTTQSMPNIAQLRLSKNNFVSPFFNSCQVIMSGHILSYKMILFHIAVDRFIH